MLNEKQEQAAAELAARDAQWSALAADGADVEAIVRYWTEDAVVVAPGRPILRGHDEIRAFVSEVVSESNATLSWSSSRIVVSESAEMAYLIGPNRVERTDASGGATVDTGRGVTVWVLCDDEVWRCAVDIWNT